MRMEQNSRSSQGSDFEQFSKFLGMSSNRGNDSGYCNNNSYNARNNSNNMNYNSTRESTSHSRPLAMVYAEKQKWQNIYDPEIALINGTIFEELNLPFNNSGCSNSCRRGGCTR